MSLRSYLVVMGLATVVAAATFFLVLFRVDPATAGALGFTLFYASLFMTVVGALSMLGFMARVLMHRTELLSRLVHVAFRQSVLIALLVTGSLLLRAAHLLTWWNSLMFVAVLSLMEFFFLSLERHPAR
jgi:hypothetical protein